MSGQYNGIYNTGSIHAKVVSAGPGASAINIETNHDSGDRGEAAAHDTPAWPGPAGGAGPLAEDEINALALVFASPNAATALLREAGFPPERAPAWQPTDAHQFWTDVSVLLEHGIMPDGRRLLLAAARRRFPANRVFGRDPG
jgi:hypothetical protein